MVGPLFLDHFEWKVYRWWVAGRKGNQYWRCTRYRDLQYCQNDRPCRHTSIFIFCLIPFKLSSKLFSNNLTQGDSVWVILCSLSRIVSLIPLLQEYNFSIQDKKWWYKFIILLLSIHLFVNQVKYFSMLMWTSISRRQMLIITLINIWQIQFQKNDQCTGQIGADSIRASAEDLHKYGRPTKYSRWSLSEKQQYWHKLIRQRVKIVFKKIRNDSLANQIQEKNWRIDHPTLSAILDLP